MPLYTSSRAASSRTLPASHSRFQSTYPPPACPQTSPDFAPAQTSPLANSRKLVPPAGSPHSATQTATPPRIAQRYAPTARAAQPCAPPASLPLPQLRFRAPAIQLVPPIALPAFH